jgi:hypothetical protein
MSTLDESRLLVRLLRESRDYFVFARDEVRDPEIARVFARAVRSRRELLEDLVATRLLFHTSPGLTDQRLDSRIGYAALRDQFDPIHPDAHAEALYEREQRLIHLMEDVYEGDSSPKLKNALKAHYQQFVAVSLALTAMARVHEFA